MCNEPMLDSERRLMEEHEAVSQRLKEAMVTFTGETLSRSRIEDLRTALEINGLELNIIEA